MTKIDTYTAAVRASLVAIAFVLISTGSASAQVPAEIDGWQTDPGTMAALPALPSGFFGPGSDPFPGGLIPVTGLPLAGGELASCRPARPRTFIQWANEHGDPVPSGSVHAVSQTTGTTSVIDTCVGRLSDATFPAGIGVADPVPIELVQLSLVSVAPIVVTFGGIPSQWNVFITEDGVQTQGTMEFTPTTLVPLPQGTVTVPNLPVDFQFRFERVGGGQTVLLNGNVNMQNPNPQAPGQPGVFQVLPGLPALPGATGVLLLGGALVAAGIVWLRRRQLVRTA